MPKIPSLEMFAMESVPVWVWVIFGVSAVVFALVVLFWLVSLAFSSEARRPGISPNASTAGPDRAASASAQAAGPQSSQGIAWVTRAAQSAPPTPPLHELILQSKRYYEAADAEAERIAKLEAERKAAETAARNLAGVTPPTAPPAPATEAADPKGG